MMMMMNTSRTLTFYRLLLRLGMSTNRLLELYYYSDSCSCITARNVDDSIHDEIELNNSILPASPQ